MMARAKREKVFKQKEINSYHKSLPTLPNV